MENMINLHVIVCALAACEPPIDGEYGNCMLCPAGNPRFGAAFVADHDPGCPWRLAAEWVQANPA